MLKATFLGGFLILHGIKVWISMLDLKISKDTQITCRLEFDRYLEAVNNRQLSRYDSIVS